MSEGPENGGLSYGHWLGNSPIKCTYKKLNNNWIIEDIDVVKNKIFNPVNSYFKN